MEEESRRLKIGVGDECVKPKANGEENKRRSQSLAHNLSSHNGGGINQGEAQMGEEQEPRPYADQIVDTFAQHLLFIDFTYFRTLPDLITQLQFPKQIPLSQIYDAVYKTSVDWINQRALEALGSFILWSLGCILDDLAAQNAGAKGAKKAVQQASSKSQVGIFVALAMVLRRKPDALISVLPTLRENSKYQGQDKIPVIVWMMTQASQGDLAVGLYSWSHNRLPVVSSKNCNPQSRDLILQLVERILAVPKARTILINGAVRKGERLIPPSAFEMLLCVTFLAPSARVKATERFEAPYIQW
ncbi:hypothetical protein SLA2020_245410 [Shorea laevis]